MEILCRNNIIPKKAPNVPKKNVKMSKTFSGMRLLLINAWDLSNEKSKSVITVPIKNNKSIK